MIVPSNWQVSEKIIKRLNKNTTGRQRAICEDQEVLLILHKPPQKDDLERLVVLFWRNKEGVWFSTDVGKGLFPLRAHIELYGKLTEKLDLDYDNSKDPENCFELLEKLAPLQRSSKNMYNALQSVREFSNGDNEIIGLRDIAYDISRNLELMYLDTKNKLDFYMAKQAELQARLSQAALDSGHRLNLLAAIFFPITAMASVFGMNLKFGLEDALYWPFSLVIFFGLTCGLFLKNWVSYGRLRNIKKEDT